MNNDLAIEEIEKIDFSPLKNEAVMAIVKRKDGNYRAFWKKNGKLVQSRCGDPMSAIQELIVAD